MSFKTLISPIVKNPQGFRYFAFKTEPLEDDCSAIKGLGEKIMKEIQRTSHLLEVLSKKGKYCPKRDALADVL